MLHEIIQLVLILINRCANHKVTMHNITSCDDVPRDTYDCAIGIHALHAGKLLIKLSVKYTYHFHIHFQIPFAIILGGTDVNESNWSEEKIKIMETALFKCKCIVAFHQELADNCIKKWSNINVYSHFIEKQLKTKVSDKIRLIPPAVLCWPDNSTFSIFETCNINKNQRVFILPCSIRYSYFSNFFVLTGKKSCKRSFVSC